MDYGLRAKVSLCMIVKNEEANLGACLDSVRGLFHEIIVIDTGSADSTKEIAAASGAKVFDFTWVDSFAAARNECLRHATGNWIFWMDADDRVDEDNRQKLLELFAGLDNKTTAFVMKCRCPPAADTDLATEVQHVRLFRNHSQMRWEHRIHEQILPAVRRLGGEVRFTDVVVCHTGYLDPELRSRKRQRDLRLLLLEQAEQPDHPFTLFNVGMTYLDFKRPAEALPLLERSLARSDSGDSIVRKLHYMIVQCHRQLGQPAEALAACGRGRVHYEQDAELLSQEGQLRAERGDCAGAEACYLQLLGSPEGPHFGSAPVGLNGYLTRHNLAVLYHQQGRLAEEEAQWQAAVQEQPAYAPGWLALGELWIQQARWPDVDHAAAQLNGSSDGAVLRARAHLTRKEYEPAKALLQETISRSPQALWPRVVLSHALLQEGRDLAAAERALRDVLALDAGHAEARQNLGVLLRQLGRAS